ncbi:outer membrane protein [Rhodocista pekingensis]|uniref:Outer membrane protein n=1 Tax=Rhodocista pekingensis TaxID=201185 RepID=A0ABW2KWF2_9PROT
MRAWVMRAWIVAGSLLALLAAQPARAEGASAAKPQDDGFYLKSTTGWDRGLGTASGLPASSDLNLGSALTLGTPLSGGIAAGWRPMEMLRLEVEYMHGRTDRGAVSDLPAGADRLDRQSVMANALVDIDFSGWVTPYVGVGLGVTRLELDTGRLGGATLVGRDDILSYQGIVGFSMPFSEQLSFFADGRYTGFNDIALDPGRTDAGNDLQSWSALAGLRYRFGGP